MGFQLMLILGPLGMYFEAAVIFVTSQTLLFRLALAILWTSMSVLKCASSPCSNPFGTCERDTFAKHKKHSNRVID